MKKIVYMVLALIMICSLGLRAHAADEVSFGAGSLIIPRDTFYQPDDDMGILETFGLLFQLLDHQDSNGYHDIKIYWALDPNKTSKEDIDVIIQSDSLPSGGAVAYLYNHDTGGQDTLNFKTYADQTDDSVNRITYIGAPFIIDVMDADKALDIISGSSCWDDIDVHIAGTQFSANIYRDMQGIPPRIALMNDDEDRDGGNADILESYLRLANIDVAHYDILTPNDIRDNALFIGDYRFCWAPHWEGQKKYIADLDRDGSADVDEIVHQIRMFVESGKGLLAECASIETFEHNKYGHFLATRGFGHNGGNEDSIIYNDVRSLYSQVADYDFEAEGGHLHNWRPFHYGDDYNFDDAPDEVPAGDPAVTADSPSEYNDTVTRFTVDSTGWDYYVAGHIDGDTDAGYVVYLGGHKYADCDDLEDKLEDVTQGIHEFKLEFGAKVNDEPITMEISYTANGVTSITSVTFSKDIIASEPPKVGDPLEIDFSIAEVKDKKVEKIVFTNLGSSTITFNYFILTFDSDLDYLKKIEDKTKGKKIFDGQGASGQVLDTELVNTDLVIIEGSAASSGVSEAYCEANKDDCEPKNIAAVEYVLLTLFDIEAQIINREYAHAAPIVDHPYVYQGSFEYPTYKGHFRRYNVLNQTPVAQWDTAGTGKIKSPDDCNADTNARQVFTAKLEDSNWSIIDFDEDNIDELRAAINLTPGDSDDTDEIKVINRLRGKLWDRNRNDWVEWANKLGGIDHSAPVIIRSNATNSRFSTRDEIAYFGDLFGMFHAIETATGEERWAFIPRNLLGKLKNERVPNEDLNFASIDSSPTAKDIYFDHDGDSQKEWRTILVCPEGEGGNYLFALDVTDPDNWFPMWEITDTTMGKAFRCAINKIKVPVEYEEISRTVSIFDGTSGVIDYDEETSRIIGYQAKWLVFVATGYTNIIENRGGINIFAFDLATGEKYWQFSQRYTNSINDVPGAVTLFDEDGDGFMDDVYVGDMCGRLWQVKAADGSNPHGTESINGEAMQIPLYNTGSNYPISVSPAIVRNRMNHTVLVFGTGGSDFASHSLSYGVYAVDATDLVTNKHYSPGAGTLLWGMTLSQGEKVWSSPTIVGGRVYVATATGEMENSDAKANLVGTGHLYSINLADHTDYWTIQNIGKARGSIFVDRKHVYVTTIDNQIIQVGAANDFSDSGSSAVTLRAWRQAN